MLERKGILLAGGRGSRLGPLTNALSKHLLPIHDKPMIYYPLSTLMLAGIREILIICDERDLFSYKRLLGDGDDFGISLSYAIQENPNGIAEAFIIAESFLDGAPSALVLGDNIFYGNELISMMSIANQRDSGATIFGYRVVDPRRYGVVEFGENSRVTSLEEKPTTPKSNFAVTGLYFYDEKAVDIAKSLQPSGRGELEITDLNRSYLETGNLFVEVFGRGMAWIDAGTIDSIRDAGELISVIEKRQGLKIGCLEEIALSQKWITPSAIEMRIKGNNNNSYSSYLHELISE